MTQPSFPHLFSPLAVGGLTLKNRILSTGHMTLMVDDGKPSEALALYHEARAAGGAGLIVTESAAVHPSTAPMHIMAFRDDCIQERREQEGMRTSIIQGHHIGQDRKTMCPPQCSSSIDRSCQDANVQWV